MLLLLASFSVADRTPRSASSGSAQS